MTVPKFSGQLKRDPVNAVLAGVCAGIAKYLDAPAWLVRVAAVFCFLWFPFAAAFGYLLATLLLPKI